jgi:hypothetical protein
MIPPRRFRGELKPARPLDGGCHAPVPGSPGVAGRLPRRRDSPGPEFLQTAVQRIHVAGAVPVLVLVLVLVLVPEYEWLQVNHPGDGDENGTRQPKGARITGRRG